MLVHGFWISRKCGRGGSEWGHQQGAEHMVAARHGCERASRAYLIRLEVEWVQFLSQSLDRNGDMVC